jgi:hypothetical protein
MVVIQVPAKYYDIEYQRNAPVGGLVSQLLYAI